MDATPLTLGQEFSGYVSMLEADLKRLKRILPDLAELALGGSAVGTGLNTHPAYREKAVLRLGKISGVEVHSAYDLRWAMQSCAPMAEVSVARRSRPPAKTSGQDEAQSAPAATEVL